MGRAVLGVSLVVVLFALVGGGVSRGADCSVSWTGGGDGTSWSDGANWSTASVPGAAARACVPAQGGTLTIALASVNAKVASVDIAEGLALQSGSLELAGADASQIARLAVSGGELLGAGAVSVTNTFDWTGGSMTGSGTTTVAPGATLTVAAAPAWVSLHGGRLLVNQGTIAWQSGTIFAGEGALLDNAGTLEASGDNQLQFAFGLPRPLVHNTGTFVKTDGDGSTQIAVPFDNR